MGVTSKQSENLAWLYFINAILFSAAGIGMVLLMGLSLALLSPAFAAAVVISVVVTYVERGLFNWIFRCLKSFARPKNPHLTLGLVASLTAAATAATVIFLLPLVTPLALVSIGCGVLVASCGLLTALAASISAWKLYHQPEKTITQSVKGATGEAAESATVVSATLAETGLYKSPQSTVAATHNETAGATEAAGSGDDAASVTSGGSYESALEGGKGAFVGAVKSPGAPLVEREADAESVDSAFEGLINQPAKAAPEEDAASVDSAFGV